MSTLPPPPPFLFTVAGVNNQIQPQISTTATADAIPQQRSSSISSTSSSFVIVVIVIASAIIISASIYLIIRCLSRRFHRSFRTFSAADDVVSSRQNNNNADHILCFENNSSASQLLNSLPLFTFGSLTGNIAGGDCAVCLSKFEREDRLRLLPLCCHAFHAECIDTWLVSNQTCPLCRSSVHPTEAEVMNKILSIPEDQRVNRNRNSESNRNGNSFRIEIGSVSRRRGQSDSGRRSYSIGSFEYIVDDDSYEVSEGSTHQRGISECTSVDKESIPEPPGERVAADVAAGGGGGGQRNWLRDYMERVSSFSLSSRALSFRGSGRFFTGSSRRNETVVPVDDLEANQIGEEISELFRWLSGV